MPSSILNSDDGVISGTAGLKNSGGDDAVLLIQTKGVTAQTVDAGQRTMFPTTIGVGGATPSTSGSGISFPATQSASTNANTLDDYEEGTFTYTINAGGSNLVSGGGTFTGYYTKIGNIVTIQGSNQIGTKSAATGDITITGLPFAPSEAQASVLLSALQEIGFADYPSARIETGATTINLFETTNAGTRTTLTNANWLNSGFMTWSTSYRV